MENSKTKLKRLLVPRDTGRWSDFIPVALVLTYLLFAAGALVFLWVNYALQGEKLLTAVTGDADIGAFLYQYVRFIGIWPAFVICTLVFRRNRPILGCLAYRKNGSNIRGALLGILLGFSTNAACAPISALKGDIVLSFNGIDIKLLLLFFIAVLIQSGAEELMNRCYLYQKLRRGYRQPWVAIAVSALFFAALHMGNTGINAAAIAQIVVVGVLYGLFIYYYDCLWAAITMHTAWNFTQNIIFGLPNSGIVSGYSVFRLDMASARRGLFYDPEFGIEGSIGSVLILAAVCVVIMVILAIPGRHSCNSRTRFLQFADSFIGLFGQSS